MAHKTLVNGTAYEISGGKPLLDGTAYSIKSGKTLVGGTAYDVKFSGHPVVVAISSGSSEAMQGTPNVFVANVDGSATTSCLKTIDSASNLTVGGGNTGCNVYLNDELVYSSDTSGTYKVDMSEATHIMVLADSVRNGQNLADARCNVYVYTYNIVDSKEVTVEITNVTGSSSSIKYNDTSYTKVGSFTALTGDVIICKPAGSNPNTAINGKPAFGMTCYWIVTAPAVVTLYYYQAMYSAPTGYVSVTQIPDGSVPVQITGAGGSYASVTINGVTYKYANTVVVPVGTVISCYAKYYSSSGNHYVKVNGEKPYNDADFYEKDIYYDYIATGKTAIKLAYGSGGRVDITEL